MKKIRTVGVKELKNNLSSYLREVRSGATVLVSDRNNVVAELQRPYGRTALAGAAHPLLLEWAEAGAVTMPVAAKTNLPPSPVSLPAGTAAELLGGDREETRR